MKRVPLQRIAAAALLLLLSGALCLADGSEPELHIGKFSACDLGGWKEEAVWNTRKSSYSFIKENGKNVLMGKGMNAASGLLHKISIDPKSYPVIRWSWKIDHTVKNGNERSKNGHDFAVRLYVVFPRGLFSQTRAIEYVWGNVMAKGELLRSPYSNNAVMIAVNSGNEQAGKWVTNRRNFADDYRSAFGEEPPKVGAVAIMTDCDNTGETAVGYYGDIDILPAAKYEEQHNGEFRPREPPKNGHSKQQHPQQELQPAKEPGPGGTSPIEPRPDEQMQKEPPHNGTSTPPGAAPVPGPRVPGHDGQGFLNP
ncbi:MAG TPA: DUF3047 domain-containing protein [Dongiaceae bacterium]|nr:DUF3047 domain-containing protein [Dongiaceae bacterium]